MGKKVQQRPTKRSFFADIEERLVEEWQTNKVFEKSVDARKDGEHFEFYDGPPFANGLPHYGHVVSSIIKDAIPRYKTMQGYHVPRRFGWDCHGLPAEMKAENDLDLGSKAAIEDYGVDRFVDYCRTSVTEFTKEWEDYIHRIGRWVDFDNSYYTMDEGYIESVMWAFKELYNKGLVAEGFKVMPYCHVCETSLSHFETRQDDSYRERTDTAVTVKFTLESGEKLVAWTTTPWTLPANLAIAVNNDIDYAIMEGNGERLVLAEAALERYEKELDGYTKVGVKKGSEFVGQAYKPPYDYFEGQANAHIVLHADFVNSDDGTGIAHEAPGFGEDDQILCEEAGIEIVVPVDKQGNYTSEITAYAGVNVFEANELIVDHLKNQGSLLRTEEYVHSYPHCWRTDNPLIYRAVSSWTIDVPKFKKELLANNQLINWIPNSVKDGMFGKWLDGVRVWNVSRDRYWGAPIPVWKTDDGELIVIGSVAELKERAVDPPKVVDLHKPSIDAVVLKTDSGKLAHRVSDVFDCWFESGSMPFAQHNYPFGDKNDLRHPADFIVEYVGQARGWFYTLHVLSTTLFDKPAFKNVIAHGVILGSDGRKMSKRLGNYPDLKHVFETYGADALRFYLFSSPAMTGETVAIDEKAMLDAQRNVFMTLFNSFKFFETYSKLDGWKVPTELVEPKADHLLDKWMLSRLNQVVEETTAAADAYDIPKAVRPLRDLVDELSNWYIRRSRRRFWKSENDSDKEQAYEVLWYSLVRICQLLAPWSPFLSDHIYQQLTEGSSQESSVHMTDWPKAGTVDTTILEQMVTAREVINEGLSQRAEASVKVRQPLASIDVTTTTKLDPELATIIAEEVNVKQLPELRVGNHQTVLLDVKLTDELRHEGIARDLVRRIQNLRKTSGLDVENHIDLVITSDDKSTTKAISTHADLLKQETLADSLNTKSSLSFSEDLALGDVTVHIELSKAA